MLYGHFYVCPECGSISLEPGTWCQGEEVGKYVIRTHRDEDGERRPIERVKATVPVTPQYAPAAA